MYAAVLGLLTCLTASGCGYYEEADRQAWAHGARSCKIKLDHAAEARDTMRVLEGDMWTPGCAQFLAADTTPKAVRP